MLTRKALALASLSAIVCSIGSGARADDFKGSKFLTYPAESQKSYISTAVMMAGSIAAQNKVEQARCIDAWVIKHDATGFQPVLEAIQKYPDYHPAGTIIAVLQKACGSFKYASE